MTCPKCSGLMTPTEIYTEDCQSSKVLRCVNFGKYEYAPKEFRIIPEKDYKYHKMSCGSGNRTIRLITCQECGIVAEGYGYKYCSRKCQNAVTNRKARLLRRKEIA